MPAPFSSRSVYTTSPPREQYSTSSRPDVFRFDLVKVYSSLLAWSLAFLPSKMKIEKYSNTYHNHHLFIIITHVFSHLAIVSHSSFPYDRPMTNPFLSSFLLLLRPRFLWLYTYVPDLPATRTRPQPPMELSIIILSRMRVIQHLWRNPSRRLVAGYCRPGP